MRLDQDRVDRLVDESLAVEGGHDGADEGLHGLEIIVRWVGFGHAEWFLRY
jgi:hypothetical protein